MLDPGTIERFEGALASNKLKQLAEQMTAEGLSQPVVYERFEAFWELKRIASWFEAAAGGVASLQGDLAAFEALSDGPFAYNPRRGPVAVTLRALDAVCRAKRSGLLSPEQSERLGRMLPEIGRCSETLVRLGFRLRRSISEQLKPI